MRYGLEDLINCQFEHIVHHSRQKHIQQFGALLETRVGISLDQPTVVVGVQHVVEAKQLEAKLAAVGIQFLGHGLKRDLSLVLHPGEYVRVKLHRRLRQVAPQIRERQLVSLFQLAVLRTVFLDRIIG